MACRLFVVFAPLLIASAMAPASVAGGADRLAAIDAGAPPASRVTGTRFSAIDVQPMSGPLAQAPAGSCLLPSGEWCWPVSPSRYGQPCSCPDGRRGVGR